MVGFFFFFLGLRSFGHSTLGEYFYWFSIELKHDPDPKDRVSAK
jgi:hypothetical protein